MSFSRLTNHEPTTMLAEDVAPFSGAVAARDEEAEGTTGQGESPAEAKVSKTDRPEISVG